MPLQKTQVNPRPFIDRRREPRTTPANRGGIRLNSFCLVVEIMGKSRRLNATQTTSPCVQITASALMTVADLKLELERRCGQKPNSQILFTPDERRIDQHADETPLYSILPYFDSHQARLKLYVVG
jgi:hypothetical protein